MPDSHGTQVARRYGSYGAILGGILGLIVGIVVSGPYFNEWKISTTLLVLAGCAAVGAFIGIIFACIVPGQSTGGGAETQEPESRQKSKCDDESSVDCATDGD